MYPKQHLSKALSSIATHGVKPVLSEQNHVSEIFWVYY